jgi:hypothetical protein
MMNTVDAELGRLWMVLTLVCVMVYSVPYHVRAVRNKRVKGSAHVSKIRFSGFTFTSLILTHIHYIYTLLLLIGTC